ncbi:hypothetical protein ATCC90586_008240 [Pythium insidiosum]|nr:hypothetical protein ATCC90586_008240 [Pythium insidiosum]
MSAPAPTTTTSPPPPPPPLPPQPLGPHEPAALGPVGVGVGLTLRKEERFGTLQDALAVVESFAAETQQRRVQVQQSRRDGADADGDDGAQNANIVVVECEHAPECKWFVRLSYIKSEKKWKISSMNTVHHKTHCSDSSGSTFQRLMQGDVTLDHEPSAPAAPALPSGSQHVHTGATFASWKEAVTAVRALAHQMGRRAVAEKPSEMLLDGRPIIVRRVVCQNHRNSNCEWMVVMEEVGEGADTFRVLSMHLLHSKECLETCNFSARKRAQAQAQAQAQAVAMGGAASTVSQDSLLANPAASLLVDDLAKYQLTHEMRWSTGKEATKAISDFALVVQRKRSKLCKRNNGGSNKKYVCSDSKCLWFVQLVKGWKSKNWKISAMNLKHSDNCEGEAKPTARQLAELRFFRQAVITHSKSNGKLLTDNFLMNSETGIKIPRGMAYRAQRLVLAHKMLAENPLLTPGADATYRQELQESELHTIRLRDGQVAFTWRTGEHPKMTTHRVDFALRA